LTAGTVVPLEGRDQISIDTVSHSEESNSSGKLAIGEIKIFDKLHKQELFQGSPSALPLWEEHAEQDMGKRVSRFSAVA